MRILSARQQFIADHSSTNYLFYAAKPLPKEARAIVSRLSSHVDVRARTASITYHSEFADLGEERRIKFLEHYDVEVREDYDWWTLSVMLEKAKLSGLDLSQYEVEGEASLTFEDHEPRVRLRLEGVHLDYGAACGDVGEDLMEVVAKLGLELREEIYEAAAEGRAGGIDALAVLKHYCEENAVLSGDKRSWTPVGETLRRILDVL
jgi:hypothetical protein